MKIYRSSITDARPLELQEELDYSSRDFSSSYPLLGIKDAYVEGLIERNDEFLTANIYVSAILILADARTRESFEHPVEVDDIYDLLESPEEEGEGYIFPGNYFELEELVYSILRSQVPLAPKKEGSELPPDGDGYTVYSADYLSDEAEENHPFAELLEDN